MYIDRPTMARARLALREAARDYLFDRDRKITLIALGPKETGGQKLDKLAIRFHSPEKPSEYQLEAAGVSKLPEYIHEFRTDVVIGSYHPHFWPWWLKSRPQRTREPRAARANPLRGGVSISDQFHNTFGTLGGLVFDRDTGEEMILSNWHVLARSWAARPGRMIIQPGRRDGGTRTDAVATLTRYAMLSHNLDAAVATLNRSRQHINDQLEIGPVSGVAQAMPGMVVVKSGRGSGRTAGIVTDVEGIMRMRYGSLERIIVQVMSIERHGSPDVSKPGDSGAWWLDAESRNVVGLHFAGSDFPERALAMDMQSVLDALKVRFS